MLIIFRSHCFILNLKFNRIFLLPPPGSVAFPLIEHAGLCNINMGKCTTVHQLQFSSFFTEYCKKTVNCSSMCLT